MCKKLLSNIDTKNVNINVNKCDSQNIRLKITLDRLTCY